ncbi:MAG: hypothetical protein FJW13_05855, partial [Actinobacteria bacterium]|nr:hypothetical protein [Actinomycetota bacterium]
MSDDRRDDTGADETTGKLPATGGSSRDDTRETAGSSRDNTLDFGEEFGVVKFADSDDSSPAIRVD